MKNLVIVESPNKVKTIQKYLGDDFQVVASVGHFLKMKTDGEFGLGIDFEKWEPKYSLDSSKRKLVTEIKSLIKESEHIYIATDPDREGEAIGSHLVNYFKIEDKYSRIKYNEITKDAILKSFNNATKLDFGLITAQQSRRMLDRIIGFRVTNLIKTKFKNSPGLPTAGRVQSIALKLVVDREKEINAFIPQQYFKLSAKLKDNPTLAYYFNPENESEYNDWIFTNEIDKVKTDIENAQKILNVIDINVSNRKVSAKTPFKQSILYKKSPFSASSTQIIIQKLYEGYGESGLISYPRTDSTRLSQTFIDQAHSYIKNKWGQDYIASEIKGFSGDQDAHGAIRPTDISLTPERARTIYPEMTDQEYKVYKLIYENTLQSLIKQPIRQSKQYTFKNGEYKFRQSFSKVIYDGYYVVTGFDEEFLDPNYELNQIVDVEEFKFEDHETKPAPRYNDGTLIEMLDTIKVGRPSTFASTVNIIKERAFVEPNLPVLKPTEFGMIINDYLINTFPDIFNEKYTAEIESQLDKIAEHEIKKNVIMQNFWDNFTEVVKNASSKLEVVQFELTEIEKPCPNDQGILLIRNNKRGQKFIGCKNFPKCKYTESLVSE